MRRRTSTRLRSSVLCIATMAVSALVVSLGCWPGDGAAAATPAAAAGAVPAAPPGDRVAFSTIAAGQWHSCALTAAGVAYCWGANESGQLGDGSTTTRSIPTPVDVSALPVGTRFDAISTGGSHTCAISGATAYCWGANGRGQLGDRTTSNRPAPTPVASLPSGTAFASIVAGGSHTCALTGDGAAYCWGANDSGQLGDASNADRTSPTPVDASALPAGSSIAVITTGFAHTCALTRVGASYCWGANSSGQLGNGTTTNQNRPAAVVSPARFGGIGAGMNHTCGLTVAGAVLCWGANWAGQLGNGTSANSPAPAPVDTSALPGGTTFASLTTGSDHSCAITAGGAGYCWGNDGSGQLGDGDTGVARAPTPLAHGALPVGSALTAIAAGGSHTCALIATGNTFCWGWFAYGQLGNGTAWERLSPGAVDSTALPTGTTFTAVSAATTHTCAVSAAGAVSCWGNNEEGQLGDGTDTTRTTPTPIDTSGIPAGTTFIGVASGLNHSCALSTTGDVFCWGANGSGQLGDASTDSRFTAGPVADRSALPSGTRFTAITAGDNHTCALTAAGVAYCWGANWSGQLGDGTTTVRLVPVPVATGLAFDTIAAGGDHTCAVTSSGLIHCFGNNTYGELGDASTTNRLVPTPIAIAGLPAGVRFSAVAAGGHNTCAVGAGVAYCWGYNAVGQVGDGTTTDRHTPTPVAGLPTDTHVSAVTVGGPYAGHACALTTAGAFCWGANDNGQLGDGTTVNRPIPARVDLSGLPSGATFTSITAGAGHTCALSAAAAVSCWGNDDDGKLGDGADDQHEPALVVMPAAPVEPPVLAPQVLAGDPALAGLLGEIAKQAGGFTVVPTDRGANTFSVTGCGTTTSPLPRGDDDLAAMMAGAGYVDAQGNVVAPLDASCRPAAVTVFGGP